MCPKILRIGLSSLLFLFTCMAAVAQNAIVDVDVDDLYYSEPGCGDCSGGPDPRWQVRAILNGNYDWNTSQEDIGACGWRGLPNTNLVPTPQTVGANYVITMQLGGYEDDNFLCGGADGDCGGLATVGTATVSDFDPCIWNYFNHYRNCTSDGTTSTYGVRWSYYWRYAFAPTITSTSSLNSVLCQGSNTTLSVNVNAYAGRSLARFYKWQVSATPTGPWSDVAGGSNSTVNTATTISLTPGQISGTRYYRLLVTSNCSADFGSNSATSSVFTVTYAFINSGAYGGGDAAPAIQSPACGSQVASGQNVVFGTLLPPTAGHATNVSSYSWSAGGGSPLSGTGSSFSWTAPAALGGQTVSLTYNFGCANPATVSCATTVSDPSCAFIYVSPSGTNNVTCGGPSNPCQTLSGTNAALERASVTGAKHIKMLNGSYSELSIVDLQTGLTIEGGYTRVGSEWVKGSNSGTNLTCNGIGNGADANTTQHVMGFRSDGTNNWKLIDLNINTVAASGQTPSGRGKSNYGVWINNSTGYEIIRTNISAGAATGGANGTSYGTASNGNNGGTGAAGHCDNNNNVDAVGGGGGAVGSGTRQGGAGGNGGRGSSDSANNNADGANGSNGGGGAAGGNSGGAKGASGGSGTDCNRDGRAGGNGTAGANGASASGAAPGAPGVVNGYYIPNGQSANGADGGGGGGGKGGGGGGRQNCTFCDDGPGSSGGGGGSGGQGGQGGTGGFGGGGSFGVYASNGSSGNFINMVVSLPGSVASGGSGGTGGAGGNGGTGGFADGTRANTSTTGGNAVSGPRVCGNCEVGAGGLGGSGGKGGNGGNGQPGAPGRNEFYILNGAVQADPSVAISSSPAITVTYANNQKICRNSVLSINRTAGSGNWTLPSGFDYVRYNSAAAASEFGNASFPAEIYSASNAAGYYDLINGAVTFPRYLRMEADARTEPTVAVTATDGSALTSNQICVGGSVRLNNTSPFGTRSDYRWEVFSTATAPNKSAFPSGSAVFSSNVTSPVFGPFNTPGTYTVRYQEREQCCGWSIPVFATITVNADPTAPTDITFSSPATGNAICLPGTVTASGASGATGGVTAYAYDWDYETLTHAYGTVQTSAPSFAAEQGANKVRVRVREKSLIGCDASGYYEEVVTANPLPNDVPVSATPASVCRGGRGDVSVQSTQTDFIYRLRRNSDNAVVATGVGTGGSLVLNTGNLSATTVFNVQVENNLTGCQRQLSNTVTVTVTASPTVLSVNGDTSTCLVNGGNGWIDFVIGNRQIVSINPNGQNLGYVKAVSYVNGTPFDVQACGTYQSWFRTATMGRHWLITPQNQPSGNVSVRLFYADGEYNALRTSANANDNPLDDVSGPASLDLSKYSNTVFPSLVDDRFDNNCGSGSSTVFTPSAPGGTGQSAIATLPASGIAYVEYSIPSFSEFWLSGTNNVSPLPIELTAFAAVCDNSSVILNWSTASEINNERFVLERSDNLADWKTVGEMPGAGNSNQPRSYQFADERPLNGLSYYRLTQYDYDGASETFSPASVLCQSNNAVNSLSVHPNPADDRFTVSLQLASACPDCVLEITDLSGKRILSRKIALAEGKQEFTFDRSLMASGQYLIRVTASDAVIKPVKLLLK